MLSLVVIAKNEEDRIERCLRSVPFAAESIVLDSGSEDRTVEVARRCGARVEQTDWPGHVAQKNRALALASQPWILSLDADEWLEPEAARAVQAAIANPEGAIAFRLARCNEWLGTRIRHGRWYPDRKVRVVRTGAGRWVGHDPHDQLLVEGPVRDLQGDIGHIPYRSYQEHLDTIDRYTAIHARSLHERGVRARWWDVALRPPFHFVDAFLLKRGFLDGRPGLTLARLGARHTRLKWRRLAELERTGP